MKLFVIFVSLFFAFSSVVFALSLVQVPNGATYDVNASCAPTCQKITNNLANGNGLQVPTNCSTTGGYNDWNLFLTHLPAGVTNASCASTWYLDADSDGYYPAGGVVTQASSPGAGWSIIVKSPGDCDDSNATIYSGVTRTRYLSSTVACGTACQSETQTCQVSGSWSGTYSGTSCTASTRTGYTTSSVACGSSCTPQGQTCQPSGSWDGTGIGSCSPVSPTKYADVDGDGYGAGGLVCSGSAVNTDCNDGNINVNPGHAEVACNGIDDNCNGQTDTDAAGYVYHNTQFCPTNMGSTYWYDSCTTQNDVADSCPANLWRCSDSTHKVRTSGGCVGGSSNGCLEDTPIYCAGGCVGSSPTADCACTPTTWYQDSDGDGYGNAASTTSSCSQPGGYVADNTDCNDADASIYPGSSTTWCGSGTQYSGCSATQTCYTGCNGGNTACDITACKTATYGGVPCGQAVTIQTLASPGGVFDSCGIVTTGAPFSHGAASPADITNCKYSGFLVCAGPATGGGTATLYCS